MTHRKPYITPAMRVIDVRPAPFMALSISPVFLMDDEDGWNGGETGWNEELDE